VTSELSRFGVAMDRALLERFDEVVRDRGSTRSAVLSDLARAEVVRALIVDPVEAVGTLTLIYDHHIRDVAERLTEIQHSLGHKVHSTMHVHLDHDRCLEVIVLKGRSDVLRDVSDRLIATPGVLHGRLELFTDLRGQGARETHTHSHTHSHAHGHVHGDHDHHHDHDHDHAHSPAPRATKKARARKKR
jgi:CopG family nickel-responsive transcriptional regulator